MVMTSPLRLPREVDLEDLDRVAATLPLLPPPLPPLLAAPAPEFLLMTPPPAPPPLLPKLCLRRRFSAKSSLGTTLNLKK